MSYRRTAISDMSGTAVNHYVGRRLGQEVARLRHTAKLTHTGEPKTISAGVHVCHKHE